MDFTLGCLLGAAAMWAALILAEMWHVRRELEQHRIHQSNQQWEASRRAFQLELAQIRDRAADRAERLRLAEMEKKDHDAR
jgi:hypothetical protein